MKKKFDNFFKISANGSSLRVEIVAGIVTFLAMSYILTLNPSLITNDWAQSGPLWASVFIATALGAIVGTLFSIAVSWAIVSVPIARPDTIGAFDLETTSSSQEADWGVIFLAPETLIRVSSSKSVFPSAYIGLLPSISMVVIFSFIINTSKVRL